MRRILTKLIWYKTYSREVKQIKAAEHFILNVRKEHANRTLSRTYLSPIALLKEEPFTEKTKNPIFGGMCLETIELFMEKISLQLESLWQSWKTLVKTLLKFRKDSR